jgi:hypothetical protein
MRGLPSTRPSQEKPSFHSRRWHTFLIADHTTTDVLTNDGLEEHDPLYVSGTKQNKNENKNTSFFYRLTSSS